MFLESSRMSPFSRTGYSSTRRVSNCLLARAACGMTGRFMAAVAVIGAFAAFPACGLAGQEKIPVALVGGAHIHAPGFADQLGNHNRVEVRYVWDPDPAVAQARQASAGGEVVGDLSVIWEDEEVSAVVIVSQTNRHIDLIAAAVEAGKHVFHDKPLGLNAEEAGVLAEKIRGADVIYQTGYFQRGRPNHQRVRELIEQGAFGQITNIRTTMMHSGALDGWFDDDWRWMADVEQAGVGGFGDLGTHVLDLMLYLMAAAGDVAVAATGHVDAAVDRYEGTDEYGEGMIRFDSGAVGTVGAGWVFRANPNTLEVSGTEGHARVTEGRLYLSGPGMEGKVDDDGRAIDLPGEWPNPLQIFLQTVVDEADAPLVSVDSSEYTQQVMTAIYRGAENRAWIEIEE